MSSRSQESTSTSPWGLPTTPAVGGFLSFAPPWQAPPTYTIYAEPMKDNRKLLLKLAKRDDNVARLLRPYVGSLVTTYVPSLGIAWASTLAMRKRWGYLYVRVPARLRKLLEPAWLAGSPIPVIVSIPPISLTNLKDGIKPVG